MLHHHILGFVVITVALLQTAVDSSPPEKSYVNQTDLRLQCVCSQNCQVYNWTLNGTLIESMSTDYSFDTPQLTLIVKTVHQRNEGTYVIRGTGFVANNCIFSLVVLGTLDFVDSSQNVVMLPILNTTVIAMNAGPSQQVASTSFTLSTHGSSPACCNKSAVQEPLPFFVTNTTYTLHNYSCPNVACTYVATLQAETIKSISPPAVLKTFTVAITSGILPTSSAVSPGSIIPTSSAVLPDSLPVKIGAPLGVIFLLLLVAILVVFILVIVLRRRLTSTTSSSDKNKRHSYVEQNLDPDVQLQIFSKAEATEKSV